jgi:hypothetical protein
LENFSLCCLIPVHMVKYIVLIAWYHPEI